MRMRPGGQCCYRVATPSRRFRCCHAACVGLTVIEIIVTVAILVGAVLLIVALLRYTRTCARLTGCSENLRRICCDIFMGAGHTESWLLFDHARAQADEIGAVRYAPGMIGVKRGDGVDEKSGRAEETDTQLSSTRSLWLLIRGETKTRPSAFVCPATTDMPNCDVNPNLFWDFRGYSEVSYGIQLPFGRHAQPTTELPLGMVLVADKGAYGYALEAGASNPGVPTGGSNSTARDWRPWNSPNHGGTGQNVGFSDSHVEFRQTPACGVGNDNIYTRWSSATAGVNYDERSRVQGTPPTGIETPWGKTDNLIYP